MGPVSEPTYNSPGTTPGKGDNAEDPDHDSTGHDRPLFLKNLPVSPLQQVGDHPVFRDFVHRLLESGISSLLPPPPLLHFLQEAPKEGLPVLSGQGKCFLKKKGIFREPEGWNPAPLFLQGRRSQFGHNKARLWNWSGRLRSPGGKTVWHLGSVPAEKLLCRNGSCSHNTRGPDQ